MNSPRRWRLGSPMNSTSKKAVKSAKRTRKQKIVRNPYNGGVGSAPVAVSSDLRQYTYFKPGRKATALKMHTCVPIAEICNSVVNLSGGAMRVSGQSYNAIQLNLTAPFARSNGPPLVTNAVDYTSPVYDLIGSAFTRYRISKLVFHYQPQSQATAPGRLVFAFARDAQHPLVWGTGTQAALLACADSKAFMPWATWSLDVSNELDDTLYYTFDASQNTASDRFSDFGVIGLTTSLANQATTDISGVLYMESEIELEEFCPITVTRPSLAALASKLAVSGPVDKSDVSENKYLSDQDAMLKKIAQTYQLVNTRAA